MNNNHNSQLFKESRPVFFAGTEPVEEGSQKKEEPKEKIETDDGEETSKESKEGVRELTSEEERKCKEVELMANVNNIPEAFGIIMRFQGGRMEKSAFDSAYGILSNPNKIKQAHYKDFIKALGKGIFPKKSKRVGRLIAALEAGGEARKFVAEEIRILSQESSTVSEAREEKIIKDAEKLLLKPEASIAEEDLPATSKDTLEATQKAIRIDETNWPPELPHKEVVKNLNELEPKQKEIFKKMLEKEAQLDRALTAEKPNHKLIKKLEAELDALNKEFEKLEKELEKPREEREKYMKRVEAQYDALERFFRHAGINMHNARKIKAWLLEMAKSKIEGGEPLKLRGIFHKETGETTKKVETFTILGVWFDRDETTGDENPGNLIIRYQNEEGTEFNDTYAEFLKMVNAVDAHEEIDKLENLNERIASETFGKNVEKGQKYITKRIAGLDKDGKILEEEHSFVIAEINEDEKTIILDHNVKAVPKEWLSKSVADELRFDRIKKEFSYGEFVKLIKQHDYKREASMEEVGELNEEGRITKEVIYIDDNGCQRWMIVEEDKENKTYSVVPADVELEEDEDDYLGSLLGAGVPDDIARKPRAQTSLGVREHEKLKKLSPTEMLDMLDKGRITNTPPGKKLKRTVRKAKPQAEEEMLAGPPEDFSQAEPPQKGKDPEGVGEGQKRDGEEFFPEGIPEEVLLKSGAGSASKKRGFLQKLWDETYWMSASDFWALGKAVWEYHVRQHERRQRHKIGSVGENLPWFGKEAARIKKHAEHENVNQFKEAFENTGPDIIQKRLRESDNKDEIKAGFIVLSERGELRWDDVGMWENLNRFIKDDRYRIYIPANGDPASRDKHGRTGEDYLKEAIDHLWEAGKYNEWRFRNNNSFKSKMKSEGYELGERLMAREGGHQKYLENCLRAHKEGKYVNPYEYAGVVMHAVEAGKCAMHEKLYYLIEGVAAENQYGRTILPPDFIGIANAGMTNQFPLLDFLTAKTKRPYWDEEEQRYKESEEGYQLGVADFRNWVKWFDEGRPQSPDRCKPTDFVKDFLYERVLPHEETRNRTAKGIRKAENMDHEDIPAYLPHVAVDNIEGVCTKRAGGDALTSKAYANGFPGFNQAIKSLAKTGNREVLKDVIKSYVRYEGIIKNRYKKNRDDLARLGETEELSKPTVISGKPANEAITEVNNVIEDIVSVYEGNTPELRRLYELTKEPTPKFRTDRAQRERQKEIDEAFDEFNNAFEEAINSDGGERMISAIDWENLSGL